MRKKSMVKTTLLGLVVMFLMLTASQVFAGPENWPRPWEKSVKLNAGEDNPTTEDHKYGTWMESTTGMKFAIDFLPANPNDQVVIYSPVNGTIIDCNQGDHHKESPFNSETCPLESEKRGHGGYGYHIIIDADDKITNSSVSGVKIGDKEQILIAHLASFEPGYDFKPGTRISAGQKIGIMGKTGSENYPVHLHFELTKHLVSEDITLFKIKKDEYKKYYKGVDTLVGDMPLEPVESLVIKGYFDNIELILDKMGWPYALIDASELISYDLTGVEQIYINCGARTDAAYLEKIKSFVESGHTAYISDLAYPYVTPWGLQFSRTGIGQQKVSAVVEDAGLKKYLGKSTIEIFYDLGGWAVISDDDVPNVLLRGGDVQGAGTNSPLAVLINAGKGRVIYTTFHNEPSGYEINPDVQKTLEYFAITPKKDTEINKLLDNYDIAYEDLMFSSALSFKEAKSSGIYVNSLPNGTYGSYLFKITDTYLTASASKSALASKNALTKSMLAADGSCQISLYKPDGELYKTVTFNTDSVAIDVSEEDNVNGEWMFKVDEYSGYSQDTMVIAASTKNTKTEPATDPSDPPNPSDDSGTAKSTSGGCDTGLGAGTAILALALAAVSGKRKEK